MTTELEQKANMLRKKIMTMEWDLSQGQLHIAKVARVNSYKQQLKDIEALLDPKAISSVDK